MARRDERPIPHPARGRTPPAGHTPARMFIAPTERGGDSPRHASSKKCCHPSNARGRSNFSTRVESTVDVAYLSELLAARSFQSTTRRFPNNREECPVKATTRPRTSKSRRRGHIGMLPSGSLRVRVQAGTDPITHRPHYLSETIPAGPSAEREAQRVAATNRPHRSTTAPPAQHHPQPANQPTHRQPARQRHHHSRLLRTVTTRAPRWWDDVSSWTGSSLSRQYPAHPTRFVRTKPYRYVPGFDCPQRRGMGTPSPDNGRNARLHPMYDRQQVLRLLGSRGKLRHAGRDGVQFSRRWPPAGR